MNAPTITVEEARELDARLDRVERALEIVRTVLLASHGATTTVTNDYWPQLEEARSLVARD